MRPGLLGDVTKVPGAKILPGNFMTVQQAIGTEKKNAAGAAFLRLGMGQKGKLQGRLHPQHARGGFDGEDGVTLVRGGADA